MGADLADAFLLTFGRADGDPNGHFLEVITRPYGSGGYHSMNQ